MASGGQEMILSEQELADALENLKVVSSQLPSIRYQSFLNDISSHSENNISNAPPLEEAPTPPIPSGYVPLEKEPRWRRPSVWTKRYGVSRSNPHIGRGRSWIDPEFPRLDPNTFDPVSPPASGDSIPEPHPEDLDRLFHTEELQRLAFGGMRTWEAAIVAQVQENMPKNMQPIATGPTLEESKHVDEKKWLKALGKRRWLTDFKETTGGATKVWTVDDPKLWAELRQVLDLTDRMIKEAAKTTWLTTFVDMRNIEVIENVELPQGGKDGLRGTIWRSRERDPEKRFTPERCLRTLENFLGRVCFNFNSVDRNFDGPKTCPYGVTSLQDSGLTTIQIDVMGIRPLLEPSVTDISKRQAQMILAITIAHELMHGALQGQIKWNEQTKMFAEPHVNRETYMFDEKLSEMGESFENTTFGGICETQAHPLENYRFTASANGSILLVKVNSWPIMSASNWRNHSVESDPSFPFLGQIKPMPSLHAYNLTNRNFWETSVAKYGQDALKIPWPFTSIFSAGFVAKTTPAVWNTDFKTILPLERPLKQMARRIQQRRKQYEQWRPWYNEAYEEWRRTPFGDVRHRYHLQKILSLHLVRRAPEDEREIATLCAVWLSPFLWPDPHNDQVSIDTVAVESVRDKCSWFYRAMGMLFTAVLPIHSKPLKVDPREGYDLLSVENPWRIRSSLNSIMSESEKMTLNSANNMFYVESDPILNTGCYTLDFPGNVFDTEYEPGKLGFVNPKSPRDLRRYFINEAIGFFKIYEALCPVPLGLKEAFDGAVRDLAQQVEDKTNVNAKMEGKWLALNFTMPAYTRELQRSSLFQMVDHSRPVWGSDPDKHPIDNTLPGWAQMAIAIKPLTASHRGMLQWTAADVKARNQRNNGHVCIVERPNCYQVFDWEEVQPQSAPFFNALQRWVRQEWPIPLMHGDTMLTLYVQSIGGRENPTARLGRFIPEYRPQEVAIRDGEDNEPFWIVLGKDIFDITNWTSQYVAEDKKPLHELLRSVPGGSPAQEIILSQYDMSEVIGELWPNRVGTLWSGEVPATRPFNIYTKREVAAHRYLNKECTLGAYIIIWGSVYDITDWARLHPAGIDLVAPHVGQDVTDVFRTNHLYLPMLSAIEHTRIGRVVPEHPPGEPMPPNTFAHHDFLYSFQPEWLQNTPTGEIIQSLVNALGPWIIGPDGAFLGSDFYSLNKLNLIEEMKRMKELITHKVCPPPFAGLPQMVAADLARFNGERVDEWSVTASYVAVGGWVYNVTNVMRYGVDTEKAKLRPWLGAVVEDEAIRSWVIETFEFAVVAELVDEITVADPKVWDPRVPLRAPEHILKRLTSLAGPLAESSNKRKRQAEAEVEEDVIAPIKKQKTDDEDSDGSDDSFVQFFEPPNDDPDGDATMWGSALMARLSTPDDNDITSCMPPDLGEGNKDPWRRPAPARPLRREPPVRSDFFSRPLRPGEGRLRTPDQHGPKENDGISKSTRRRPLRRNQTVAYKGSASPPAGGAYPATSGSHHQTPFKPSRLLNSAPDPLDISREADDRETLMNNVMIATEGVRGTQLESQPDVERAQAEASRSRIKTLPRSSGRDLISMAVPGSDAPRPGAKPMPLMETKRRFVRFEQQPIEAAAPECRTRSAEAAETFGAAETVEAMADARPDEPAEAVAEAKRAEENNATQVRAMQEEYGLCDSFDPMGDIFLSPLDSPVEDEAATEQFLRDLARVQGYEVPEENRLLMASLTSEERREMLVRKMSSSLQESAAGLIERQTGGSTEEDIDELFMKIIETPPLRRRLPLDPDDGVEMQRDRPHTKKKVRFIEEAAEKTGRKHQAKKHGRTSHAQSLSTTGIRGSSTRDDVPPVAKFGQPSVEDHGMPPPPPTPAVAGCASWERLPEIVPWGANAGFIGQPEGTIAYVSEGKNEPSGQPKPRRKPSKSSESTPWDGKGGLSKTREP